MALTSVCVPCSFAADPVPHSLTGVDAGTSSGEVGGRYGAHGAGQAHHPEASPPTARAWTPQGGGERRQGPRKLPEGQGQQRCVRSYNSCRVKKGRVKRKSGDHAAPGKTDSIMRTDTIMVAFGQRDSPQYHDDIVMHLVMSPSCNSPKTRRPPLARWRRARTARKSAYP